MGPWHGSIELRCVYMCVCHGGQVSRCGYIYMCMCVDISRYLQGGGREGGTSPPTNQQPSRPVCQTSVLMKQPHKLE